MKLKVLTLIGAGLFALTACGGKAVTYDEFHQKAVEAYNSSKEVSYSKVVLDGSYKDSDGKTQKFDKLTISFDKGLYVPTNALHADEDLAAIAMNLTFASLEGNSEDTKYYVGGFKSVYEKDDSKLTKQWNKYGLVTSIVSGDTKFSVSYSK